MYHFLSFVDHRLEHLTNQPFQGIIEVEFEGGKEPFMQVIKRSGEVVEFDPDKIYQAVIKAAHNVRSIAPQGF